MAVRRTCCNLNSLALIGIRGVKNYIAILNRIAQKGLCKFWCVFLHAYSVAINLGTPINSKSKYSNSS